MAWYPHATRRVTNKHGYGNDDSCLGMGIVAHSMEGGLAAAFGELDRADRQASWHFSVSKSGAVWQHIDTVNISYASGSYQANKRFWSIEHEGRAGEPLTEAQRLATMAVMGWLLEQKNLKPIRKETLWEHREMMQFGAAATACPSGRIPWNEIIAELEEDDILSALTPDEQREVLQHLRNLDAENDEELAGIRLIVRILTDLVPDKWNSKPDAPVNFPRWVAFQQINDLLVDAIDTDGDGKADRSRLQYLVDHAGQPLEAITNARLLAGLKAALMDTEVRQKIGAAVAEALDVKID